MLSLDPFDRFDRLFARAREAGEPDASAHVLATASAGQPSARYLLLKGVDGGGFVFFTNYRSRKAQDLAANPSAAVCFYWPRIGAEVTARGAVERITAAESDAYFTCRPRGSRLGAWASRQSLPLGWRPWLVVRWLFFAARFFARPVPRPPFWGGFRLQPDVIEFVQHEPNGASEHTIYTRADDAWRHEVHFAWRIP